MIAFSEFLSLVGLHYKAKHNLPIHPSCASEVYYSAGY